MNQKIQRNDLQALRKLRRELVWLVLCALLFMAILFLALRMAGFGPHALRWLVVSAVLSIYPFTHLWRHLPLNRLSSGQPLFDSLGPANRMTITRSVLNACLAGFLVAPRPEGWAAWVPGLVYLVSAVLDFLDGYVARITGRATLLGQVMDMDWDCIGVLFGTFLAVRYGQAPLPYVLVGLARYLYLFGIWLRGRLGLPVYDVPLHPSGRPIAGMEMGFLGVILLPVFTPPATQVAALLFMLPLVFGFLRDWMSITHQPAQSAPEPIQAGQGKQRWGALRTGLPLTIRVLVIGLLVWILLDRGILSGLAVYLLAAAAVAIPALLLGAAGRIAALLVLLVSGFVLQVNPLDARFWLILLFSFVLFMTGTGKYSLWKPEEWLIYHHAGER